MFQLEFYETEDGKQPVSDFLDSLNVKMSAKMTGLMEILEERGTELRLPYSRSLGGRIIVTNGFTKKTLKTPPGEIKLAKARRADWIKRHGKPGKTN